MTWSSSDLAQHCLSDRSRTHALQQAIHAVIRPGDRVLDIGSGTGILGLTALDAGAKEIEMIELDPVAAAYLRHRAAGSGGRIRVCELDAREMLAETAPDVMLIELLDVWFLEEDFCPTVRQLAASGVLTADTVVVPSGYTWRLEVGSISGELFPLEIVFPYYEWPHYADAPNTWHIPTFEPVEVFELGSQTTFEIATGPAEREHTIEWTTAPAANLAFRLSGDLHLADGHKVGGFPSLNSPVVIPAVSTPTDTKSPLLVSYQLGGGVASLRISCAGASLLPW